ncbi:MAG: DoxX family protein [Agriterribacter sp.]
MKKINIIYWIVTGILAAMMMMSGIFNAMVNAQSIEMITKHLGYPEYFIRFVGIAKILGAIALVVPGFPRIKEWAYAGFVYDLTGALYSSISVGDPASAWAPLFIGFALIALSYIYYHKKLKATGAAK